MGFKDLLENRVGPEEMERKEIAVEDTVVQKDSQDMPVFQVKMDQMDMALKVHYFYNIV